LTDEIPCVQCKPMCMWDEDEVLMYDRKNLILESLNLTTKVRTKQLQDVKDQFGRPINAYIYETYWIHPNQLLITTQYDGLYFYDKAHHTLTNRRHDPADPTTVVNNVPMYATQDSTGWVFISATPNGVSYFNQHAVIGQQLVFQDGKGKTYDGFISHMTTLDNDTYYISASQYLIEWKRSTNQCHFMEFPLDERLTQYRKDQVVYAEFDQFKHLWVGTISSGIYVLDSGLKPIHHFPLEKGSSGSPLAGGVTNFHLGPDGWMWVTTGRGLVKIDPHSFRTAFFDQTKLAPVAKDYCRRIEFFDSRYAWICTLNNGVWQYDMKTDSVIVHNRSSGLSSNEVLCVNQDKNGNLYFGTTSGLTIQYTNGQYRYINETNGLLNKRVEALLLDKSNRMWMGNDVGIACFNIADSSVQVFDERYGLSIQGFRTNAYHQNSDDELLWGTERGLQYFYPDDMMRQKIGLRSTINKVESKDLNTYLTRSDTFRLSPGNNFVTFHFATIDYSKHLHTFYQYQLTGIDPEWINIADQNIARYNSLRPGTYTFQVRASNDRKLWVDAENEITLVLDAFFWEKSWFRWLLAFSATGLVLYILSQINKRQKKRTEALETESVINYFASQINVHKNMDDMLWDVAKKCISRLNLEECVIYRLDAEKNVLHQKAAYGPKTSIDQTILQPIDIPVGQGITGSVALTKKPEVVNNTEKDARYIVDDERRYSEMAVPIIVNGEVFGVIDSEHSQRNFFTPKHLSLMTTISILTANQIQRILAEEEKQKAEIEVLQNKQKATESRLQSLRLQMNPHFLFNALNSIQQMILANEEMVATRYLSRFSKLLRSILIHSDKEMISLKEELDILKLYVELESVRFKDAFSYDIICDMDIDSDEIKIPTLLIQPFVENAIWHGLMHKEGQRNLRIEFIEHDDVIQCIVEDNGIGRQKAKEMKISTGQDKKHTSKGIEVSLERLKAMQKNGGPPGTMMIHDLVDEHGHPRGTRIEINLPIQN
jgi:putative methionine-R-sulfoxide reductase with GAF domain/anti-sigma regulatory factor (Ser/Thr protein kinase)